MKQLPTNLTEQDDATQVRQAMAGNEYAFTLLLERYLPSVERLCTRLLGSSGNRHDIQDIVQETCIQAFLGLAQLREPAQFGAWFRAIATNLARMELRKRHDQAFSTLFTQAEQIPLQVLWSHEHGLDETVAAHEIQHAIMVALQELSPVSRQVVTGFYIEGYSYTELAKHFDVPEGTVKSRLFAGRRHLRTLLQPLAEAFLYKTKRKGKERSMQSSELVEMRLDAIGHLMATQQPVAILREVNRAAGYLGQTGHLVILRLTQAETDLLLRVLGTSSEAQVPSPLPGDLAFQISQLLQTKPQRVVIKPLVRDFFYATVVLSQEPHPQELNTHLADGLLLALRAGIPIMIARSVLEAVNTSMPTAQNESVKEPSPSIPNVDDLRPVYGPTGTPISTRFFERTWAFMLELLTGSHSPVEPERIRTLDLTASFPNRQITWDEQPMIAVRLPEEHETAWILVQPATWHMISESLRESQQALQTQKTPQASTPTIAQTFSSAEAQLAAEQCLQALVNDVAGSRAILLNPSNGLLAWTGFATPEEAEQVRLTIQQEEAQRQNIIHQGGSPPQNLIIMRSEHIASLSFARRMVRLPQDWKLVVEYPPALLLQVFATRLQQTVDTLEHILSPS